ncbi:MAG: Fic family protein, partial [Bacteroidota bacterium]
MQQQMQRLRIKVEKEKLLMTQLPELSLQIIDYVRNHGRITMSEAATITQANRNTLKVHFKKLLEQNFLLLEGKGRGAWYRLP